MARAMESIASLPLQSKDLEQLSNREIEDSNLKFWQSSNRANADTDNILGVSQSSPGVQSKVCISNHTSKINILLLCACWEYSIMNAVE